MDFPRKEAESIDSTTNLCFQITDWYIPESDRNRKKPETPEDAEFYTMIIYGTDANGLTVSVRTTGYEPYFYVKPPEEWESYPDKRFISEVNNLMTRILEDRYPSTWQGKTYQRQITTRGYESHFNNLKMVKRRDFWGFSNNKDFRFIKVSVKSLFLYNNYKYYFDSLKSQGFKMYESNIDPFLRYIHEADIKPCGWVSITNFEEEENSDYFTRCDYNIVSDYKHILPVVVNKIAPLMIASFDIECTSSHGDFPVAKKDYRKVAQDLANVAKAGYNITTEFLLVWFEKMYTKDIVIEENLIINRVYPKVKPDLSNYTLKIEQSSKDIIAILDEISNISGESDDDVDEEKKPKTLSLKKQNILEFKLNDILSHILPPLKGDQIIQIGTTVHRYGSDEIIYKHIICLNSCDEIENVDVVACNTEKQLLMEWKNLMIRLNPDILTGYNIFGFDMEYIWLRAGENKIVDEFAQGLGRNISRKSNLVKQELSSSALGDNIMKYFDLDGTVVIDLFKVIQRDHKLDSYKLDNVAEVFIGDKKADLKPHEIFSKFQGCSSDRCVIAKYCVQDCALVNRLMHKLKILENNIGMGNVCLVPLNFLFKRGQGIKIFSLVAKQCMDRGYLIPVNKYSNSTTENGEEGYEGAVVLEPKEGIYLNDPIVVFDYGSLYPSSMIARNLSHDCYVMDEKYRVDDPNVEYITVSYDLYEGKGDKKVKFGVKECTFAQYKDGKKGIISDILCMLLKERKNTRKKMEYETIITKDKRTIMGTVSENNQKYEVLDVETNEIITINKKDVVSKKSTFDNFEQDVFDALQLAYKITANSLYGQIGAKTSPIYMKDIAACTTATGREMIMLAKDYVETKYNAEVIYGDSVMPYTPITFKTGSKIHVSTFDQVDGQWIAYDKFKPCDNSITHKEQTIPVDAHVWTHNGWSKIKRIIRHKTQKRIYRVVTNSGIVDVTEDHSLLDPLVKIIKPCECKEGDKLLHSSPSVGEMTLDVVDHNLAYLYGQFISSGSCYKCFSEEGVLYSWEITSKNTEKLQKCCEIIRGISNIELEINDTKLVPKHGQDISSFVKLFDCCYLSNNIKIIPNTLLNSDNITVRKFLEGFHDMNSDMIFDNQVTAQTMFIMFQKLNLMKPTLKIKNNKFVIMLEQPDNVIRSLDVIHEKYSGYVYDIETEEGVFHGGCGNMILKNTDSIFCKFPLKNEDGVNVEGKDSLKYAIEIGKHVESNIKSIMPVPQKLNYEKSLYPFILFSKKKYVGNLYEMDTTKFKQKSMGIVLKRRDNAPIVKKIFGGIIDILLNKHDLGESIEFLREELQSLVEGNTPISDLVVSKSLKGTYKDPTKISHKVLADRIGERDPGNKPQVNDRIPFVYIAVPNAKLQGDRIENPDYIVENNLQIDSLHYITNQIMNPVLQLYALCLEDIPGYNKSHDYWDELGEELKKKPMYQNDVKRKNRIDSLKSLYVKELLFDEFIYKLSEPKVKKPRKNAKIVVTDEIEEVKTVKKPRKNAKIVVTDEIEEVKTNKKPRKNAKIVVTDEIDEVKTVKKPRKNAKIIGTNEIDEVKTNQGDVVGNVDNNIEYLAADIKIVKKKDSASLDSVAKITEGKKTMWKYTNTDCNDKANKKGEFIHIIVEMVKFAKDMNKKLNIKVNFKQFVSDYYSSLALYKELEANEKNNKNSVQNTIDTLDTGAYKNISSIIEFESIIMLNDKFTLVR
jgi:DNA polymerase elongation subunit (family B)